MLNVLESSHIAQLAIGLDHKVTYWNRACELLTGLSAEKMTGGKGRGKGSKRWALQEFLNLIVLMLG